MLTTIIEDSKYDTLYYVYTLVSLDFPIGCYKINEQLNNHLLIKSVLTIVKEKTKHKSCIKLFVIVQIRYSCYILNNNLHLYSAVYVV